jgi:hypothetical protein
MTSNTDTVWRDTSRGDEDQPFPVDKADHAMGLELQIVELVEQQTRAVVQHRPEDAARLDDEISELRTELAATVEAAALR